MKVGDIVKDNTNYYKIIGCYGCGVLVQDVYTDYTKFRDKLKLRELNEVEYLNFKKQYDHYVSLMQSNNSLPS